LLEVEGVPQVGSYITSGEVDAGFVNKTEALAIAGRAGSVLELPQSCYDPIEISLGTVRDRSSPRHKVAFRPLCKVTPRGAS
jgi:molybdate transport system substrate-binding protein